jgi:hypothetical protein
VGRSEQVREISPPMGFDSGPSSPHPVSIPTELPGPQLLNVKVDKSSPEMLTIQHVVLPCSKETCLINVFKKNTASPYEISF